MAANQSGQDMWGPLEKLRLAVDRLPPGHQLHGALDEFLTFVRPFQGLMGGGSGDGPTPQQVAAMEALAVTGDLSAAELAVHQAAAGVLALNLGEETDPDRIDDGLAKLRLAVEHAGPDNPQRVMALYPLAVGLLQRFEQTNAVAEMEEAAALLQEAVELAGGPHHPMWTQAQDLLSRVLARLGRPEPRKGGLDGLRGHTYNVLLQSDLAAANKAAQDAAGAAVEIAGRCISDGDAAGAVRALDAGRGLALYAATEIRNVGSRLVEAGQQDLAERWAAADADDPPAGLRGEVMQALAGHSTAAGLLDPPTIPEIRSALLTLGMDALVYLMPAKTSLPGAIVIVPVEGAPSHMVLPNLAVEPGTEIDEYLAALPRGLGHDDAAGDGHDDAAGDGHGDAAGGAHRDFGPRSGERFDRLLDRLCDWAWRAAVGPLVQRYLPSLPRPATERPPRMVLVPMGELARIPWQAARRPDGTYAVRLVAFSPGRLGPHAVPLGGACSGRRSTPVGLVVGTRSGPGRPGAGPGRGPAGGVRHPAGRSTPAAGTSVGGRRDAEPVRPRHRRRSARLADRQQPRRRHDAAPRLPRRHQHRPGGGHLLPAAGRR